ncbi:uncharacterized protein LOC129742622 [Uranotaenia lowii]|uniref:uncharacterized protein LOC129742622 n=1 Tax=Uranotaenia lowii TaxID=190385 RepID=UPI00247A440B|nr:uncharacterized protein LOC129742622 [Uranotaenia lowii]
MDNVEKGIKNENLLDKQNDVATGPCGTTTMTEAPCADPDGTIRLTSGGATAAPLVQKSAVPSMQVEQPAWSCNSSNNSEIDADGGNLSGGGPSVSGASISGGRRRSSGDKSNTSRRKTRRGKTKRGGPKRSSSSRPYSKSQWKYQARMALTNKRRAAGGFNLATAGLGLAAVSARLKLKAPLLQSDQPPLVPYNTNRFLMEDHMPHVLTPSEDEEEFLTKEFSSVYEDARSERLEGLSKTQLIQEYLQLEANFEQVTRRYSALKALSTGGVIAGLIKEENESAPLSAAASAVSGGGEVVPVAVDSRRRLEDRIRELTVENLELRRQLEQATRIGMVLSAKSSPRGGAGQQMMERMVEDSSDASGSSEDSESDSSSTTSSSSSNDDDSSSSMSEGEGEDGVFGEGEGKPTLMEDVPAQEQNGVPDGVDGDIPAEGVIDSDEVHQDPEGEDSRLAVDSINSPPPPLVR